MPQTTHLPATEIPIYAYILPVEHFLDDPNLSVSRTVAIGNLENLTISN
ncbi:MAG: hypothetical protein JGK24_15510 [Microcoleus sp. PH2017_29_MFU_D_A]|nr:MULTISPECIES: hypothetical protein [unclassified Microcoleus]MCC3422280.1 hypothetical protein [Microcoleus sp. PH2017_07_MST_O_A]MCC3431914.1 hypothetical protein [Microcoleus sp. PH2017_04_SCI_O_A]MCC3445229.1 hypothetical protein [Microcoleus sp. PH2017_03_ELD_O_A]MCC3507208.1 hypothetical protein [Microcoleus sp. PH2017_19_SFW_U_A]MCC3513413.1 hypothetical protein [Microcoleus sp. PH2017_17_BER_D_A]MCC3550952.1 hypothetical protein [Microcoleus sp. PH2017_24_DOB_U_A]MCC3584876.1 hypot